MMRLGNGPFEGRVVRLEPLGLHHRDEMRAALDRDPDSWAIQYASGAGPHFGSYWSEMIAAEANERIAFAVRLQNSGRLIGTTSYLAVSPFDRTVEIGATFYIPEARDSAVNPEAKLLLLTHAFDQGAVRVQFSIDSRNTRSQAAVAKLGAVREGLLRRHRTTWTGHIRDTVIYSIVDRDWPHVRTSLEERVLAALSSFDDELAAKVMPDQVPRARQENTGEANAESVAPSQGGIPPSFQ